MLRGLKSSNEQDPQMLLRDTRTMGMRFADFFKKPLNAAAVLVCVGVSCLVFPQLCDLIFLIGIFLFIYTITRKQLLPFRMPMRSRSLDYNDLSPGNNKPKSAGGICYFGNELQTNAELWFSNDDMRTHALIFGSTGSGKTEALVSLGFNALVQGSGLIYVDGKGDNSLFSKVFSMARYMGREDDVLLVNFMTGARDVIGPQERRLSNTMNPFANGSSSMLAQLVVSLMDSSSASPDGDMWKGRAISFVESLMKTLVYMRDQGKILLDANTIRNYFILDRLEMIVLDKQFPRDNQEPVSMADVPDVVVEPIRNYVINLPGYDPKKKGKQSPQCLEQHGFITMQLTRVFTSLADTYGHIIRTNLAEVDFKDVVLNRRILVVLLPALEKSPDELSNLGKVIVSSLKAMMASGLGEGVEGEFRDVIQRKPTNAPTPFMCILDEYGYYAVEGFAVVPAQARSLGFSAIFAGQDLPAFQKASKEEALSIGANTNIKICMKLEDPIETWDFFSKTAGEAFVTKVDSFQTDAGSVFNNYLDTRSASAERRARIDLLDLKEQRVGEAHIFFKSKIVRAKLFYANPPATKAMRLNHFLKVDKPATRELLELEKRTDSFADAMKVKNLFADVKVEADDLGFIAKKMREGDKKSSSIDRAVATLTAYYQRFQAPMVEKDVVEAVATNHITIFSKVNLSALTLSLIDPVYKDYYTGPILRRGSLASKVELVERLAGKGNQRAAQVSSEVLRDVESGTSYPPQIHYKPPVPELVETVQVLLSFISQKEKEEVTATDEKPEDAGPENSDDFKGFDDLNNLEGE